MLYKAASLSQTQRRQTQPKSSVTRVPQISQIRRENRKNRKMISPYRNKQLLPNRKGILALVQYKTPCPEKISRLCFKKRQWKRVVKVAAKQSLIQRESEKAGCYQKYSNYKKYVYFHIYSYH